MDARFTALAIVSAALLVVLVAWQSATIRDLEKDNVRLVAELDMANAMRKADHAAYEQQIKLIREVQRYAQEQHDALDSLSGLSDADWVDAMFNRLWNQDPNSRPATPGVDAGTVRTTAPAAGTATGQNDSAVRRGHEPQGN